MPLFLITVTKLGIRLGRFSSLGVWTSSQLIRRLLLGRGLSPPAWTVPRRFPSWVHRRRGATCWQITLCKVTLRISMRISLIWRSSVASTLASMRKSRTGTSKRLSRLLVPSPPAARTWTVPKQSPLQTNRKAPGLENPLLGRRLVYYNRRTRTIIWLSLELSGLFIDFSIIF